MRLRSVLFCAGLLLISGSLCRQAQATVVARIDGSERQELCELFGKEDRSIRIRCSRLSDLAVLQALVKASKRGVQVRVIVDTLTPGLKRVASSGSPHFLVHVTSAPDRGRFFPTQVSYAFLGRIMTWYGVKSWSPRSWRGKSQLLLDSRHPNDPPEVHGFEQLWGRSQSVPIISTQQASVRRA